MITDAYRFYLAERDLEWQRHRVSMACLAMQRFLSFVWMEARARQLVRVESVRFMYDARCIALVEELDEQGEMFGLVWL